MIKTLGIRQKLMLMVIITVFMALFLTTFSLVYYSKQQQEKVVMDRVSFLADVMAVQSTAALKFMDEAVVSKNLQSLIDAEDIDFSCFYNYEFNRVLVSRTSSQQDFSCNDEQYAVGINVTDQHIIAKKVVSKQYQQIGFLLMIVNLDQLKDQQREMQLLVLILSLVSAVLALLITLPLRRNIYLPVMQLRQIAYSVTKDRNWSLRAERLSRDEMGELVDAFNNMLDILLKDQKELDNMANMDSLTGLPNRRFFREKLGRAISHSRTYNRPYGLILIDLDDFKWVNDNLGYDMGDKLLVVLSQRFRHRIRRQDVLCRIGGDEFTIVVDGIEGQENLVEIAELILQSLEEPIDLRGTAYIASSSLGLAMGQGDSDDISSILKKTDLAVHQSKAAGKNRYNIYSEPN